MQFCVYVRKLLYCPKQIFSGGIATSRVLNCIWVAISHCQIWSLCCLIEKYFDIKLQYERRGSAVSRPACRYSTDWLWFPAKFGKKFRFWRRISGKWKERKLHTQPAFGRNGRYDRLRDYVVSGKVFLLAFCVCLIKFKMFTLNLWHYLDR